jgi:hypothetical protein
LAGTLRAADLDQRGLIGEKVAIDLAGKVVLVTNKKDLPSGSELRDGETIELDGDEYLKSLQLMPSALPEFQNQNRQLVCEPPEGSVCISRRNGRGNLAYDEVFPMKYYRRMFM